MDYFYSSSYNYPINGNACDFSQDIYINGYSF